ncbi:MAG: cytochrome c-type biosis protein CcmE [Chloroflexota bacterium]|jgi:cytochrome c-type biogenesis protein CcmE|nr:cytochrome c-type biosis protein CcmE [Chloroflexota bacterium]
MIPSPRRPRVANPKILIAAAVIFAAVGFLVYTAVASTAVYYLTVSELQAKGPEVYGQSVRVAGNVVAGSIQRDPTSFDVRFMAADGSGQMPVAYRGVLPDIFGDGIEVVVEGKYRADGTFAASTLLAKCPSKFES